MEKMKAVILKDIGKISVELVEKPKPQRGEILMEVKTVTTCGTDVKTFVRGYPNMTLPRLFGHGECAGVVAEIGEGVEKFKVGDRISAHNSAPCMECEMCLSHNYMACLNWRKDPGNINKRYPLGRGGYQEYLLIPEQIARINTFKIPDHISYEEACQLEPFSCAVNGSAISNIKLGDTVAIIGSGPQGLYHMQVSGLLGATTHIMIDLVDYRLKMAEKIHAKRPGTLYTLNPSKDNVEEKVKEITDGLGPDVVIEAAGLPETDAQAIRMVRKLGLVNMYAGTKPGSTITVDLGRIHYGGLTIKGTTHTNPYYVHKAWKLLTTGGVNLKDIVTSKMSIDEVPKAMEILTTTKDQLKIAIIP